MMRILESDLIGDFAYGLVRTRKQVFHAVDDDQIFLPDEVSVFVFVSTKVMIPAFFKTSRKTRRGRER